MSNSKDLQAMEQSAYTSAYSDGIIDLFVGLSLTWIGAVWIFLPDLAALAGILPAVFVAPMLAARKQIVEERIGYVKWADPRRRWERRNLIAVLTAGVLMVILGVGAYVAITRSSADGDVVTTLMPGVLAWLLALIAVGLGFLMQTWRMFAYAAVLAVGGMLTAWADGNPGWPMLSTGIVISAVGMIMLVKFVRDHPVVETM